MDYLEGRILLDSKPPEGAPHEVVVVVAATGKRRRRRRSRVGDGEAKKRKLSDEQVKYLEEKFWEERKLESGRKTRLAMELGLDPKQVAVWFQNRRARWKCKQMEEEYARLKMDHDAIVLDKYNLEAQILKLNEQLLEAHGKIEKLSLGCGRGEMIDSPSTSASVEIHKPTIMEDPGVVQQEDPVGIDEYNYHLNMWDLLSIYGI